MYHTRGRLYPQPTHNLPLTRFYALSSIRRGNNTEVAGARLVSTFCAAWRTLITVIPYKFNRAKIARGDPLITHKQGCIRLRRSLIMAFAIGAEGTLESTPQIILLCSSSNTTPGRKSLNRSWLTPKSRSAHDNNQDNTPIFFILSLQLDWEEGRPKHLKVVSIYFWRRKIYSHQKCTSSCAIFK